MDEGVALTGLKSAARLVFIYFHKGVAEVNENKILAAILTIAVSARASRASSLEVGEENWRGVVKDYERILAELDPDLAKKAG